MNKQELAKMIDQTLLKPYVSLEDLRRHCVQAAEYGFKTVAINNAPVPFCKATYCPNIETDRETAITQ